MDRGQALGSWAVAEARQCEARPSVSGTRCNCRSSWPEFLVSSLSPGQVHQGKLSGKGSPTASTCSDVGNSVG